MSIVPLLLVSSLLASPEVRISTLDGQRHSGQLQRLTTTVATLSKDGRKLEVPLSRVLDIRFASASTQLPGDNRLLELTLNDGSNFSCTQVTTADGRATVESPLLGSFSVHLSSVTSLRLGTIDSKPIEAAWRSLHNRKIKNDLLVIRKENILDHLDGVVGNIDANVIKFLLDSDEIPVNRNKAFGIVYYRRNPNTTKPVCKIELTGNSFVNAKSLTWNGDQPQAVLLDGTKVSIPLEKLRSADFSFGKLQYLSQMEPRDVEYTPFFDVEWKYRRDKNLDGDPIRLGNKTYRRGLCIHSKTFLRYRIGGDYRRFQAIMGIDDAVGRRRLGDVHVVISGDGKKLLEADVRGTDTPRPIDLDVTGIRDLEILVDFGGDLDISDHLDLADAKIIK